MTGTWAEHAVVFLVCVSATLIVGPAVAAITASLSQLK
jgi:hypothetical protein